RLHIARLVDRTALDHGRLPVPLPRQAEAGQRARQHWLLQRRFLPVLAAVDRDIDTLDLAMPAPGDARYLVETLFLELLSARRPRDDGFRLHVKGEFTGRAVRHQVGIFRGLFARIDRLGNGFQPAQPFDVHVAFETRQQQAERIALLRAQSLAVLAVDQHRVVETFFDRD